MWSIHKIFGGVFFSTYTPDVAHVNELSYFTEIYMGGIGDPKHIGGPVSTE